MDPTNYYLRNLSRLTAALLVFVSAQALAAQPLSAQTLAAQERLWYYDASGETLRNRQGSVQSYADGQWEFVVEGAGVLRLNTDRVVALEFAGSESWNRASEAFRAGKWKDAFPDLLAAYRDENRPWAKFEIQAAVIRCALAIGRDETACRAFQELLDADPQTRHRKIVPLAWTRGVTNPQWQAAAEGWLKAPSEWDKLLGASWLLQSDAKEQARTTLVELTRSRDKTINYLASMQLKRDELAALTAPQLETLKADVEQGPSEFRSGPRLLVAAASARLTPGDQAAIDYLKVVLDEPAQEAWEAEGLLGAARQLAATNPEEARLIVNELIQRFPDSDAAQLGRNLKLGNE